MKRIPRRFCVPWRMARERGLDAVVINLGGGFQDFLDSPAPSVCGTCDELGHRRPAVHPMKDLCEYMQAADLVVQASLAEGGGMSPLEALACGTPVVATAVGGMALTLERHCAADPAPAMRARWPTRFRGCSATRDARPPSRRCAAATTSKRPGRATGRSRRSHAC